jgi:hypothetical protein
MLRANESREVRYNLAGHYFGRVLPQRCELSHSLLHVGWPHWPSVRLDEGPVGFGQESVARQPGYHDPVLGRSQHLDIYGKVAAEVNGATCLGGCACKPMQDWAAASRAPAWSISAWAAVAIGRAMTQCQDARVIRDKLQYRSLAACSLTTNTVRARCRSNSS